MIKQFCDRCSKEIPRGTSFFPITASIGEAPSHNDVVEKEFCSVCAKEAWREIRLYLNFQHGSSQFDR